MFALAQLLSIVNAASFGSYKDAPKAGRRCGDGHSAKSPSAGATTRPCPRPDCKKVSGVINESQSKYFKSMLSATSLKNAAASIILLPPPCSFEKMPDINDYIQRPLYVIDPISRFGLEPQCPNSQCQDSLLRFKQFTSVRKLHDLLDDMFLVGVEYACPKCATVFSTLNPRLVNL